MQFLLHWVPLKVPLAPLQPTKYGHSVGILSPLCLPISPPGLSVYAGSMELNGIKRDYLELGVPLKVPLKSFPLWNATDSNLKAVRGLADPA